MLLNFRKIFQVIAPSFVLGAIVFSCEPTDVIPKTNTNTLEASIGSEDFVSSKVTSKVYVAGTDTLVEIVATGLDQSIITLQAKSLKLKTTYLTNSQNPELTLIYKKYFNGSTTEQKGVTGLFTITEHDPLNKEITGSFEFTTPLYTIKDGQFLKVKYTIANAL